MPSRTGRRSLSAAFVKTVKASGRYGDGRNGLGLSLLVKTPPTRDSQNAGRRASASAAGPPASALAANPS